MSETLIPYARQEISEADIAAVVEVLRGDCLTQGPVVPAFENAVAIQSGARYAVAVNSATSALHVACLALNVGSGDVVWTTPNTFVASANCARYCGAMVDFVDIDSDTWCMSAESLAQKLENARLADAILPKVVIPVHFAGQSCDMEAIAALGLKYGFKIIEDASHAIGGRYQGRPVGDCSFSDIAVFSFHPAKIITTGEGGMALTCDSELAMRMTELRSHGITRDPTRMTSHPDGLWYYQQLELGFNYRMTDIQAALGLSQLSQLDMFVARRNVLAANYDVMLADLPIPRQVVPDDVYSARHLYVVRVPPETHTAVFTQMRAKGIGVNLHYIPVHLQPYYRQFGFSEGQFPMAESYYREAISLPMYAAMTDAQQNSVCEILRESLR